MNLKELNLTQLSTLICKYNGQTGTPKQVQRLIKFYKTKEMMINFLSPRIK